MIFKSPKSDGNILDEFSISMIHFFPFVIFYRYYQTLEFANAGDVRPFMRFIAECTEKTLDLFLWSTLEYATSSVPALEFYRDEHI